MSLAKSLRQCFSNRVSRHICVSPKFSSVSQIHFKRIIWLIKMTHINQIPESFNNFAYISNTFVNCYHLVTGIGLSQSKVITLSKFYSCSIQWVFDYFFVCRKQNSEFKCVAALKRLRTTGLRGRVGVKDFFEWGG
jgi:hypothetical protein